MDVMESSFSDQERTLSDTGVRVQRGDRILGEEEEEEESTPPLQRAWCLGNRGPVPPGGGAPLCHHGKKLWGCCSGWLEVRSSLVV